MSTRGSRPEVAGRVREWRRYISQGLRLAFEMPRALRILLTRDEHPLTASKKILRTLIHDGTRAPRRLVEAAKLLQAEPRGAELCWLRDRMDALARRPLMSVLLPTYNSREDWLVRALDSVMGQLYPNWELCVADDASTEAHVRRVLGAYAAREPRIRVQFRQGNGGIAAASQTALSMAQGEFVALLDHDDELAPHALLCVAEELNVHSEAALVYSDEDKINSSGLRCDPYFKPDWNPDLFLSHNLVTHLAAYRTARVREVGGFRAGFDGAQDYDLTLRFVADLPARAIRHIPHVLYHWRQHPDSTAHAPAAKPYAADAARRVIADHLRQKGIEATVLPAPDAPQCHRVRYALPSPEPRVTIIVPTRNGLELLRPCVDSMLSRTDYKNFDVLIVDNGSDDPKVKAYLGELAQSGRATILHDSRPFNFSALINAGARQARGEILALLNNDIEALDGDWLRELVSHAVRPEVGIVGARLWFPNFTLQHAGVILGIGGVAAHAHKHLPKGRPGYAHRALLIQNFSAVTAACMVVRKSVFDEVGGFDETLTVAFNDVDFCLRVRARGYRILWTPYAELLHHESATRGYEVTPEKRARFKQEVDIMKDRWGEVLLRDPAYNPNLTLERTDYSIAW